MKGLTTAQKEVLHLMMVEHLSVKEIALRRGTSVQNIHQHIEKLRKKSALNQENESALKFGGVVSTRTKKAYWRFHKLHFVMRPYYLEPRYQKYRRDLGNYGINFGEWVFIFHEDIVEMRLKENVDFVSAQKWEALSKAQASFQRTLTRAENKYGFRIVKDQKANVRIRDQHLAATGSGVAKARKDDTYVSIRGVHDGKIYFVFDKSRGVAEHEYVHSDLAISDSEKFEPFFNSIRHHPHYLPHESKEILDTILAVQLEYAQNMREHVAVMREIKEGLREMREVLRQKNRNI
jgi:hypothetical protein